MHFLFYLVLIFLTTECRRNYSGYRVAVITTSDPRNLDMLLNWRKSGIDFWSGINTIGFPMTVMVPPYLHKDFYAYLESNSIPFEERILNLEKLFEREELRQRAAQGLERSRRKSSRNDFDFAYYWTPDIINDYLWSLSEDYNKLIKVKKAEKSYEGHDILVVRISNSSFDGTKPKIFIDAGTHAREWIAPMVAVYLIYELVENSDENTDLLACDWIIIPCVNPDGYQYSHDNDRLWKKTRSFNEDSPNCFGVDVNRNYDYRWGYGSSSFNEINPCNESYPGPDPFSEIETETVAKEMKKEGDGIDLYISFHSYGNFLVYPWSYDKRIPHDNQEELEKLGNIIAYAIYSGTERNYTVGNSATLLSPASGTSEDYASGRMDIDLSYTLYLPGGGKHGFDLPGDQIAMVSNEVLVGLKAAVEYIEKIDSDKFNIIYRMRTLTRSIEDYY